MDLEPRLGNGRAGSIASEDFGNGRHQRPVSFIQEQGSDQQGSWKEMFTLTMSNGIRGSQISPLKCRVGGQSWRESHSCKQSV